MDQDIPIKENAGLESDTQDLQALSSELCAIVEGVMHEHLRWAEAYGQWANNCQVNMQMIPPQAIAEYQNRTQWISGFINRFVGSAGILHKHGSSDLKALVDRYMSGFGELRAAQFSSNASIAAENAATQQAIAAIQSKMNADSLKAGADRLRLQQETAAYVQGQFAAGLGKQQESYGKMYDAVKVGLFGR